MKQNTPDQSLRYIRNNIPKYVKNVFEKYIALQVRVSDLLEMYKSDNLRNASVCASGLKIKPFFDFCKDVFPAKEVISIHNDIEFGTFVSNSNEDVTNVYDESISKIGEGDIYSPVTGIRSVITAFDISNCDLKLIPTIYIAPLRCENVTLKASSELKLGDIYNDDMMGTSSLFDLFEANVFVDVNHLLTRFFNEIYSLVSNWNKIQDADNTEFAVAECEGTTPEVEFLNNVINMKALLLSQKDEDLAKITDIIEDISNQLTGSAVITYLAYFAKMIGAKTVFVDWCYKVFMKDFISKLDQDMITSAGADINSTNISFDDDDGESIHSISGIHDGSKLLEADRSYNQIQLGFTNWSFIIDTILHSDPNRTNNNKVNKYATVANVILVELLKNRYTTYNDFLYTTQNGPEKLRDLVEIGVKRIYALDNITYLKELKATDDITAFIRNNLPTDYSNYKSDNTQIVRNAYTNRILGDIFLKIAYLTLLDYSNLMVQGIQDENDFYTGKSRKEILSSKYGDMLKTVIRTVNVNSDKYSMRNEKIVLCSDYRSNIEKTNKIVARSFKQQSGWNSNTEKMIDKKYMEMYTDSIEYLKRQVRKDENNYSFNRDNELDIKSCLMIYDIRPLTIIKNLKDIFETYNINEDFKNDYNNDLEDGEIGFLKMSNTPKFTDLVTDSNLMKNSRMFNMLTLESLEQAVEEFEQENSVESEWAYGCYNALAGMTSGVVEVTNEADAKATSPLVSPDISDMANSQDLPSDKVQSLDDNEHKDEVQEKVKEEIEAEESYRERAHTLQRKITSLLLKRFD